MNLEHPPLMKALAGFSLKPLRLDPSSRRWLPRDETPHNEYSRFLYLNRVPAHEILQAARRPFPLVFGLLIVSSGRRPGPRGPWAGLLAAGLIALDPGFVAHASIVHTDVGAALTMTTALVLALAAARRRLAGPLGPFGPRPRSRPRNEVLGSAPPPALRRGAASRAPCRGGASDRPVRREKALGVVTAGVMPSDSSRPSTSSA